MIDRLSISFTKSTPLRIKGFIRLSQLPPVFGVYLLMTYLPSEGLTFEGAFELHKNLAGVKQAEIRGWR